MGYLDDQGALAIAATDDIFAVGDTDDLNPLTGKRVIKRIERDNIFGQGLGTTDTPEFDGLTISSTAGMDVNSGADEDLDLITVGVTGTPVLSWEEAGDYFLFNKEVTTTLEDDTPSMRIIRTGITNQDWRFGLIDANGNFNFRDVTNGVSPMRVDTGGINRAFEINPTKIVINVSRADLDFEIRGDNDLNLLFCNAGNDEVNIGTSVGGARLAIDQSSATGAKPVLLLDQGDIDVVLMKIIGTAEAASADRTLVADSDYGTPGALVGWIQVNIQDDGNRVADGDYYIPFYAAPT